MILHSTTSRATPVRVLLTGANGGYGRTLLDQLRRLPDLTATQLVDMLWAAVQPPAPEQAALVRFRNEVAEAVRRLEGESTRG